jgi:hypothetical protein
MMIPAAQLLANASPNSIVVFPREMPSSLFITYRNLIKVRVGNPFKHLSGLVLHTDAVIGIKYPSRNASE